MLMFKRLLIASTFLWSTSVLAQNTTCSTRPPGDSSNACASTAFVGAAVAGLSLTLPAVLNAAIPGIIPPGESFTVTTDGTLPENVVGTGTIYSAGAFVLHNTIGSVKQFGSNALGTFVLNDTPQVRTASAPSWSSLTTYAVGAVVSYSGLYYSSLLAGNINNIPSSSPTQWQVTFNGAGNAVGGYFSSYGKANNSATWGINPIIGNAVGGTGANIIGDETDIDNNQSSALGNAFEATGASISGGLGFAAFAVQLMDQQNSGLVFGGGYNNTIKWSYGLYEQDGSVTYAAQFAASQGPGSPGTAVSGAPLIFSWYDSTPSAQIYQLQATPFGMILSGTANSNLILGAVQLVASPGIFDTYLSNTGHAGVVGGGAGITSLNLGNGTAPIVANTASFTIGGYLIMGNNQTIIIDGDSMLNNSSHTAIFANGAAITAVHIGPSTTVPTLFAGSVGLHVSSIAGLPTCNSSFAGDVGYVTDATAASAATFHGTVTGGGTTTVNSPVSCNGQASIWQYE